MIVVLSPRFDDLSLGGDAEESILNEALIPQQFVETLDGRVLIDFPVEDAAAGIVRAAECYDGAEPVNLGTGREITIRALVQLIVELTGYQGEIIWDATKPDGQPRRALDTTRARERFGFSASTGFEEGLRRTIAWYEAQRQGAPGMVTDTHEVPVG